jgi:hypothetical protein
MPSPPTATGPIVDPTSAATDPPIDAPPVLDQAWATADLTDVATGGTFRIADLAGRVVVLETLAIWCSNCRAQQADVYRALDALGEADVAYVLLGVDPNETAAALATYRERNGFTGTYAIAGRDVSRALAADFGDQVLSPPSTPMVVIGTDGRVTLTPYGHKGVDEIVALARDHGA